MSYRIGIDARFYRGETGGLGRYTRSLLAELGALDRDNDYTVILTPQDEREYVSPGSNFRPLVVDIPHYSVGEQTRLLKLLNKERFDLVHFAQFNHPLFYRRPFVVTIHDIIMHFFPGMNRQQSPVRQWAYERVFNDCKRAERILVPSQSTRRDLAERLGFPAEKLIVTAEGGSAGFGPRSHAQIQAIRQKLQLPERYLIFVSRWAAYKGIPVLLPAFEKLTKKYPDLGLVLCGKPDPQNPSVSESVAAAQKKGLQVITPGFVSDEDLQVLYAGATVYVHPSQYEGFGIMILEAFAAGVPVVTSDTSSLPEVAGDAALLVDPTDVEDLTGKIDQILQSPTLAAELKSKGFEQAKKFSWSQMATDTLEVYRDVLG